MKIEVTKRDIDKGCARESDNCPIARAVRRATNWKKPVHVSCDDVQVGAKFLTLPVIAGAFVQRFDAGGPVKPFSFNLTRELR